MDRLRRKAYRHKQSLRAFLHPPRLVVTYNYRHDLTTIPTFTPNVACELRRISVDEISILNEVWHVPLEKMRQRLHDGHHCYAVFVEGRIAHYQWVQLSGWHNIQQASRRFLLGEKESVFYHVRVAEWARGHFLSLYAYTQALKLYRSMGHKTAWVYTTRDNIASQKGIERAGWVFHEGYRALKFGEQAFYALPGKLESKLER